MNPNIRADKYGMGAISHIYKAFGDNIRSKEYWPWSENVGNDWAWEKSKGTINDLENAIEYIKMAMLRLSYEYVNTQTNEYGDDMTTAIKKLRKRLENINLSIDIANEITEAINNTTLATINDKENIDNMTNHNDSSIETTVMINKE